MVVRGFRWGRGWSQMRSGTLSSGVETKTSLVDGVWLNSFGYWDLKYPAKENAVIWGVCMVVWGFRWGVGWSQMIEIEVGDTLKVS